MTKEGPEGVRMDLKGVPERDRGPMHFGVYPPLGFTDVPHGASEIPKGRPWGTREQKRSSAWAKWYSKSGQGSLT